MHPTLITRFPKLVELWSNSRRTDPANYFRVYDAPTLNPGTERQFVDWEALLQGLDPGSFNLFLRKASGLVTAHDAHRGWPQLVERFNELRGYHYAISLGYSDVRLIQEQAITLPDIQARSRDGRCLIEVKTIQKSDLDIQERGQVQRAESGLPTRLKRALRKDYSKAVSQIENHPWSRDARKICYLIVNIDLQTVLAKENEQFLIEYLEDLETTVEIHSTSQHWTARPSMT